MTDTVSADLLEHAVEEISALRAAAAYEAAVCAAHGQHPKIPRSRRAPLAAQVERLGACAHGRAQDVNSQFPYADLKAALTEAGAPTALTAPMWEAHLPAPRNSDDEDDVVPRAQYSRALDEIWALRLQLAYEAVIASEHGALVSFPKSQRVPLSAQIDRLRASARGQVITQYAPILHVHLQSACRQAGIATHLPTDAWLAELNA